ncbi:ABC transporter permease [Agrobacterium salinitolerans]|uniref:ABC transporter permease n=1 Tax=Agrobacterium salinitolerans TaxID=1183413 RepID=UPI0015729FA6|nr:ABC transporter permease [Agrobacterium salinitolerans]NTA40173.1 ABC transporter permease [Agrobacterium salinitolerans]
MLSYIIRRLVYLPFSVLLVSAVAFIALRATGNPVDIYLNLDRTQEQVDALTARLHLDEPIIVQFGIYVRDVLSGNFGESLQFGGAALEVVVSRLGATMELLAIGVILAVVLGVFAGLVAAVRKDRLSDFLISSTAVAAQSMPSFWLGILLIQFFSVDLQWLPTSGRGSILNLVMPATTLAAFIMPNFVLITRASVLETLGEQFIVTAKAKGMSQPRIFVCHVLPNALNPILSFLGLQVGRLIGGAIVTETIFAWPGVGRLMVSSIFQRDVPVVLAGVFIISLVIICVNLLVDILISLNDPRIGVN